MGVMNFLRRHMQVVTALGATAAFTVSAAPQTLGLGKYRKIMASFHEGKEDEIPESIRDLTEKVYKTLCVQGSKFMEVHRNLPVFLCEVR